MGENRFVQSVYLYVPNIIGYTRIVLALISFYYMPFDYVTAGGLYLLSCFLDAIDGYTARYLNQASMFGAVLDLLTDRVVSPVGLVITLAIFYPQYALIFQIFLIVDITSHWLHLHSTILTGKKSHKLLDKDAPGVMKLYYSNRVFLFSLAAANELFFISLYLLKFTSGPAVGGVGVVELMAAITAPFAAIKTAIGCLQLSLAVSKLVSVDEAHSE